MEKKIFFAGLEQERSLANISPLLWNGKKIYGRFFPH